MSVVIRSGGMLKMYIKGADSIIKARLSKDQTLNLDDELNRFSRIGLRTLLIGMRIISEGEYSAFKRSVEALPPTNKEEAFNKLVSDLEQGIYLIGATAVLDRLQDEVPETIRDLIRASKNSLI
jgi:magnesium-transporting ATPase (P-type)